MSDKLKKMKECLMGAVEAEMYNLADADTKELGEVIDMIKDLSEAIYYCTVTEAMGEWEDKEQRYYTPSSSNHHMPDKMYYGGDWGNQNYTDQYMRNGKGYTEHEMTRDSREGRSPQSRRMYMEGKEIHMDKTHQMRELEKYVQELTADMIEMIEGASPEEKQYLSKKITVLANKITQLNSD